MEVKIGCKVKFLKDGESHIGWVVHHDGLWDGANPWWVMGKLESGEYDYSCHSAVHLKVLGEAASAGDFIEVLSEAFGGQRIVSKVSRIREAFGMCQEELEDG